MKRGIRNLDLTINKKNYLNSKRSQVWVETVIYTLIAFVIIGLVLSFVRPRIMELQDRAIIDQSINIMNNLNNQILSLEQGGPGNRRKIELSIEKGSLNIDGENDQVYFEIESSSTYSEPGEDVQHGEITIHTKKIGDNNEVNLTIDYSGNYNITYEGENSMRSLTQSSTPYTLFISNRGGDKTMIDFELG